MFTVEPRQWVHGCQLHNSLNFSKCLKIFIITIGKVTCFAQSEVHSIFRSWKTNLSFLLFLELFGEPE